MVLYMVGLGLGDERDITVRGLEVVRGSAKVVLEHYTSVLGVDVARLEAFYGKPVVLADRDAVESQAESIYESAKDEDVAFLVVGDPLCATTHTDMMIRARERGIRVEVIHNASVMGAVASCGLQLYSFGQTVSIPFWDERWRPSSFYDRIACNKKGGMHTLCLLDIKVKEPDFAAMARGRTCYLPPRFMTVRTAVEQLLEAEATHMDGVCAPDSMAVGLARLGQPSQRIVAGKLQELLEVDFGGPLHSLVLCGETHPLEAEVLQFFMFKENDRAPPPVADVDAGERENDGEEPEGDGTGEGGDVEVRHDREGST
ncbi:unnamed protein product [Phaeothamnion confervicola]